MTSVLDAALRELARGRQPIPVPDGQRGPVLKGWPELRLSEDDLSDHFSGPSNLGILNGEPSGNLVDVDLDCPEALRLSSQFLPTTHSVFGRPGNPRSHRLYFADPLPATTQFKDPDGTMLVEVLSTGTQTIFPPSIHVSGEPIDWDEDEEATLVDGGHLTVVARKLAAACLLARHWPEKGGRHDAALALAGGLSRLGWSEGDVAAFIEAVAHAAGDEEPRDRVATAKSTVIRLAADQPVTGWQHLGQCIDGQIVAKVREWLGGSHSEDCEDSEAHWEPPIPLSDLPRPPFPVSIFPDWVRTFVEAVAVATQTPLALAAMLVLACLATACAKRVVVQLTSDWREPVNLFTVVAMLPAERKSAVFTEVTRPIEEFEAAEIARLAPEIAEAGARRKISEQALVKAQRDAATAMATGKLVVSTQVDSLARELAAMDVPAPPQLIVDDCSPERLASLLAQQRGRMAVMAPEGDVFDLMSGRYSPNGSANFGVYLRGHAGDDLRVDRVSRKPEFVRAPALTMGLAVQPEVVQGLISRPGFRGRGLLGRFLYGMPPSMLGQRDVDAPPVLEPVREAYHHNLTVLLTMDGGPETDDWGQPVPQKLVLAPDAASSFLTFRRELEPRLGGLGDLGYISDWAGKLAGAVGRIAGLLHMAENVSLVEPWTEPVSHETVRAAIRLADEFLIPHALVAFAQMGANPAEADARHILEVLANRGISSFTKRDLFQIVKGRFKTMGPLDRALEVLEEHGYIRFRNETSRGGPGRKASPTADVNPLWRRGDAHPIQVLQIGGEIHRPATTFGQPEAPHNSHNPQNDAPVEADLIGGGHGRSNDNQDILEWESTL
jgi:hypothetical protein